MKSLVVAAFCAALVLSPAAHGDDDGHFEGLASETLEEAVANLRSHTALLEARLSGDVDQEAMMDIHELSYTLENAVERLSAEIARLADVLEEVHLASEQWDDETVRTQGAVFVDGVRTVLPE
ncbi:hypothetical protein X907_1514 [Glycocaulis alkaliphilus]|uniref:Uncharacterized protein n=1 Tax=Glycocaulis alkaliphilus TaxID=1434191 RepID=A0A3T0E9Z8_9PROT|nr:DUF6746 family protein [Glycocaulis alkaliphilus]AZU04047.1 hypothetical protein X907_1514 [Glycocaulis alkaliphilus]GGB75385.1 hypothetical protein GCM10007417_13990 [Glycocaulis alkaliphilus]